VKGYDLIVVGAGPAGSTAARSAALKGLDVLLLEKDALPRFKPCAGGLSLGALRELDFSLPKELVERRCVGMRVIQGAYSNTVRSDETIAFMVSRPAFDEHLARKAAQAGAELREAEAFVSLEGWGDGLRVLTEKGEYRAKVVIGADGYFSRVAPSVRDGFSAKERRFCLIADLPMPEAEIDERMGDFVTLRYGFVALGYAWVFPKRDRLSFGLGGSIETAKGMAPRMREFVASFGIKGDYPIRGCFIPVTRFGHRCFAERILLAGDAAGFVDCFSGEGMRAAIASGRLAAETAAAACAENDFSPRSMKRYQDAFYAAFKDDLDASNRVSDLSFRYPGLILGTLLRSDEALLRYCDVTKGELSFAAFAAWVARRFPLLIARRILGRA
jgi:geranylgeranyl reductase family protein